MMHWADNYIGLSHGDCGGCWGLVRSVYQEQLGVNLPTISMDAEQSRIKSTRQKFSKVSSPQEYDIALFKNKHGLNAHVGIMLDRQEMLHVSDGVESCVVAYDGMDLLGRLTGFYRYAG
jgi:cell wall-associated NlpC family hydrolase